MPYVFSTLSCDNEYRSFSKGGGDIPIVESKILIKGGAGIVNKNIITPLGVMTQVTDEELKLLEENESFKMHRDNGYIVVENKKADADEVAKKSMKKNDKSSPVTPEDYVEKAPVVNG